MRLKRYIGDKAFYRRVMTIVIPIIIQNGITNFVSLLDNIMVGRLGTESMSGVAALDFASALWCWLIYHLTVSFKWIGAIGAGALAAGMCFVNWKRIRKVQ